jgi:hypothetical protein
MRYLSALLLVVLLLPAESAAQRRNRLGLGLGLARFIPLQPLATDDTDPTEYELDAAGITSVNLDYWWKSWLATRLSYQWFNTDLAKPEGASFAKMRSGYAGVLLAPIQVGRQTRPYLTLGGGYRRYDVGAFITRGGAVWALAPRQTRLAGFVGVGSDVRIARVSLHPEAGVFFNEFRHRLECSGCSAKNSQADLVIGLQLQLR